MAHSKETPKIYLHVYRAKRSPHNQNWYTHRSIVSYGNVPRRCHDMSCETKCSHYSALSCVSLAMTWTTMLRLLVMIPQEEQQRQIRDFPSQDAVWNVLWVFILDGYCHLDLLADSWGVPCDAIQQVLDQALDRSLDDIANCCFQHSLEKPACVTVQVVVQVTLTFRVHTRVIDVPVDWTAMDIFLSVLESESVVWTRHIDTLSSNRIC